MEELEFSDHSKINYSEIRKEQGEDASLLRDFLHVNPLCRFMAGEMERNNIVFFGSVLMMLSLAGTIFYAITLEKGLLVSLAVFSSLSSHEIFSYLQK